MKRFLIVLSLVGAVGCSRAPVEEVETDAVVPVEVSAAEMGTIRAVIHATGDVNPAAGAEMLVTAPQPARISAITKAEGDRVRRGEVLVRFDIPNLDSDVASRTAEVNAAQARVQAAEQNVTRLEGLLSRGVAARKEVEDANRERAEANGALLQAQAGGGAARQLASRASVTAAFDGIVAKRLHNPGDMVDASATDVVLRVIDPTRLQIDASVPIPDLSRVVMGASARLLVSGGDPVRLKVVSRPVAIEPDTAAAPVRLAFLAPPTLAVGTPVQVEIDAEQHANVVLIPSAAVVHEGDETAVFVVSGDKKAQRRPVVIGIVDNEHAEVTSGVKAGEQVITRGQAGLPDGATVAPEKPAGEQ